MSEYQVAFAMMISALASSPGVPSGQPMPEMQAKRVEKVWVSKPSGALQCEPKGKHSLSASKRLLTKEQIPVFQSKIAMSSTPVIALCGAPTGEIHTFRIDSDFVERAEKMGFTSNR